MNYKKSISIILLILFTSQILFLFSSNNMKYTTLSAQTLQSSEPLEEVDFIAKAGPGFEKVKSNLMRDGGFAEGDSYGGPEHFNYWADGYEICNASYQDDVHGGSYGLYYAAKGTDQFANDAYVSRSLTLTPERAYLVEDISLDLWFKVKANPDITSGAYSHSYVRVYTGSQNYYIYYVFTGASLFSNQSTSGYYDVRQPVGSWFHLQRNVTYDFEELFPSVPILPSFYVYYLYFRGYTVINPTGFIEILVDDVSITNGTAFNYLSANGDFEAGDGSNWPNYRTGPASVKLSNDDFTEGSSSLNLTTLAYFDQATSYAECGENHFETWNVYPDGFYPTEPGEVVIDFDWKYSETLVGGFYQDAQYFLKLFNETFSAYLYFYLGEVSDTVPASNFTQPTYMYRYYEAPGFGSKDTWEHFTLDVYKFCQLENLQNLIPDYFYWRVNSGYIPDSSVTLLIDNFSFVADPLGDPSFEQDINWHPNDPLNSWESTNHNYVNRTNEAHSGNYAANISAHSGSGGVYAFRYTYLPVDDNLYTDFWWRLDELSGSSTAFSYLYLELDSKYIYYILGKNDATPVFFNTSNTVYYTVEGQNQTGTWHNLFRNVKNDAVVAFGDGNYNITFIWLSNQATGTSVVTTIFDDLYFVRDIAPPEITNLVQTPLAPQYDQIVTIEVDITDNIAVDTAYLYYKIGSGDWQNIVMGNVGVHYTAQIPIASWDTLVKYYLYAYDIYGLETYLGLSGFPFEYTVIDTFDPLLDVEAPPIIEPIVGNVIFNITGEDPGSGIALFEIVLDTETVFSDAIVPTNYTWVTTYHDNGNHTIIFTLEDNAGNVAIIELEYIVENLVPWYVRAKTFLQKWYPYIAAGAGVLIIGSFTLAIVIQVRRRRRKKVV